MNKSIIWRIILVVILAAAIIGFAVFAYNAGVSQGMAVAAQSASSQSAGGATAVQPVPVPAPYPYYGYWHWGPWFGYPGFGFLGCLVPLFFFFLIFFLLRGLFFWRGPRHWGYMHGGMGPMGEKSEWRERIHSTFNEWHNQAHSETETKSE